MSNNNVLFYFNEEGILTMMHGKIKDIDRESVAMASDAIEHQILYIDDAVSILGKWLKEIE